MGVSVLYSHRKGEGRGGCRIVGLGGNCRTMMDKE